MDIGLTVSTIDIGQRSDRSGHNETDYISPKVKRSIELYVLLLRPLLGPMHIPV